MKQYFYLAYAWGSVFLYGAFILWIATIPELNAVADSTLNETIKIIYRITLYALFFVLTYRALIITLKNAVSRLSVWHSKDEKAEDAEFVLIIESLIVVVTVLLCVIFATFEEYIQYFVDGRNAQLADVLVSGISVLLTGIVVYSTPIISEFEFVLKDKLFSLFKK